jgi:hypothetical protein
MMATRTMLLVTIIVSAMLQTAHAHAGPLETFLADVEKARRFTVPARADVGVEQKEGDVAKRYDGVVVHRDADVYLEIREPAVRVLMRGEETAVYLLAGAAGAAPTRVGGHAPIAGTPLIPDDVRPFRTSVLRIPQIADETSKTMLVSGAPAEESPYVLVVYLFDREKKVPTRVQYYERTVNNLVRMRRESDFVRVAETWQPTRTEIEDYQTSGMTTIERTWTASPEIPHDLFDPAALGTHTLLQAPVGR